jgi:sulfur-oxidizing protein SoxY
MLVPGALLVLLWICSNAGTALASEPEPPDPLHSPSWSVMHQRFFKAAPVIFDDRVQVTAPENAENPLSVPVRISADGLDGVREILIIADLNPIQKILTVQPTRAAPGLSFRFKIEQSTPIRAAMRTGDGVWHLGGRWISAAGGGCTTPSGGSRGLWQGHLGEMNARLWPRAADATERLRLRVVHPMDTGLASGIPAFYIDRLVVRDAGGKELAALDIFEPMAENPVISLDLRNRGPVRIDAHDIQGNRFSAEVSP